MRASLLGDALLQGDLAMQNDCSVLLCASGERSMTTSNAGVGGGACMADAVAVHVSGGAISGCEEARKSTQSCLWH